jgi:hypothetical protein
VPGNGPGALKDVVMTSELLEAAMRAAFGAALAQQAVRPEPVADDRPDLPELLSPVQVEKLTGIDRNTVDRMVADGELPHAVLRKGARKRMVRVPKAFVLRMLADLNAGTSIRDMAAYTANWQPSAVAGRRAQAVPELAGAVL